MSWTLYIPTAITGVVGLAGIGGSVWSAKIQSKSSTANLVQSIDAENKRVRETTKRQLYAASLAAFNEMLAALIEYSTSADRSNQKSDAQDESLPRLYRAHENMNRSLEELMLIAPREVGVLAVDLSTLLASFTQEAKPGDRPNARAAGLMRTNLLRAMRDDLGEGNWGPEHSQPGDAAEGEPETTSSP